MGFGRVLLLTEEQGAGGIQTTLGLLRRALQEHGWQVDCASVRQQRPRWLHLLRRARQADVLVASNNFYPAYWTFLLGLLTHRPSVIWVHGPLTHVLAQNPPSALKKGFLQGLYNLAQALVFSSRSAMASFEQAMPGVRQPLRQVIHNPAPTDTGIHHHMPTTEDDTVHLGFVGRLSAEKRPERLLQTLSHLPQKYHLHIVGDGPLRSLLETQCETAPAETRLRDRVHFLGEQVVTANTYRAWQATLLCSAYEGYPMVALESMAAGTACLGTPLPALTEMLGTEGAAWISPEDSPASLARTIQLALQSPSGERRALALSIAGRHPFKAFANAWRQLLGDLSHTPTPSTEPDAVHKQVHFIQSGPAYMPELAAYRQALEQRGHKVFQHTSPATVPASADVVWWICGRIHRQHTRRLYHSLHVHEYASASVAPWAWLKDRIKQFTHPRPQHRVFQSEWLRQHMGLADDVPYSLRDMGVPAHFLNAQAQGPCSFDLVYLGEMSRLLQFMPALRAIGQAGLRLLLIGQVPPALQRLIEQESHIYTTGRIAQDEVPAQLLRAAAGLNLVPDVLPLSHQTSTKMLEYLAVGLPVISNPSPWAIQMAAQHPGRITLAPDLTTPQAWQQAMRLQPGHLSDRQHLQHLCWDAQLRNMPLWQALDL